MNKPTTFSRHKWAWMVLCLMGLILLQITACVHEPVLITPDPNDTIPTDTMPVDTMPVDTIPMDTIQPRLCDPDTIYFAKDLLPLFVSNCAMSGCHDAISHRDGVILDTYDNIIKTTEIKLTNPASSDIYEVITETDLSKRMPPPPANPIASDDAAKILKWIQQGAQNLTCDEFADCDTANVSYSGLVKPVIDTHCVGCHGDQNPGGGIQLNTHAKVAVVGNSGLLIGTIAHQAGFKPMPQGAPKLADCTIAQISAWLAAGAPNN